MFFANPWGLLGLLSLPAIIGIHLYRRRFPPLLVAGSHLWGVESRVTAPGRRLDRLPITASLLLELLAALLLSLALADPRLADPEELLHLVVVLDDSASMQATPAGERSFRDRAIAELERRAVQAGSAVRMTLIRTGAQPALLGTRGMTWSDARTVLADWRPSAPHHSAQAAWDEAIQLIGERGQFLFLTDGVEELSESLPGGMELVAVGQALPNCAFTAARWLPGDDGAGTIFLRVANHSRREARVRVTGRAGGQDVIREILVIPASSEAPLTVPAPAGLERVDLALTADGDALALDNVITLLEPQPRVVRIALGFAADSPERSIVQRALDALPGWIAVSERADLLIDEATHLPENRDDLWWLGLGPLNRSEAIRRQAMDVIGPYLLEHQHPLLQGVTLGGVVWGGVQPTDLRLLPLISVDRTILLGQLADTRTSAWILNVDLGRSNLTESPDWPILLSNLVELCRDALPGLRQWNFRVGEAVRFRLPADVNTAAGAGPVLVTPGGRRRPLLPDRNGYVETPALDEVGMHEVWLGERSAGSLAVNFLDPAESLLLGRTREHRVPPTVSEPVRISLDNPLSWLLMLGLVMVLLAVLLDWRVSDGGRAATVVTNVG